MTQSLPISPINLLIVIVFPIIRTNGLKHGSSLSKSLSNRRRFLQGKTNNSTDQPIKLWGDDSCPCMSTDEWSQMERLPLKDLEETLGDGVDYNAYGISCGVHDWTTKICSNLDDCTKNIPVPSDCDKSYCHRFFCYVNPNNCALHNSKSVYFENAYYSYATCGDMDSFTNADRMDSVRGKTFRVALNSNTGGWLGAYNPEGNFAVNDKWSGPVFKFLVESAQQGGFLLNITHPPEWLRPQSEKFFGESSYDFCIYATSLGYLDICIAGYTITGKRASVTPFMEITNDPVFLVTFADGGMSPLKEFSTSVLLIFQPFTGASWLLIAVVFLPLLGFFMLFHEYGGPGSVFPNSKEVIVMNAYTGEKEVQCQKVTMAKHISTSLYMPYLAFLNGSYDPAILSSGGKVNLIAIMFFILLVTSVYTANLAAILTQEIAKSPVSSLEEAVKAGYNFCIMRQLVPLITNTYDLDPSRIVVDPVHLGGDGQPGFRCPDCQARSRVFDVMLEKHSDASLYCNAAIAPLEDLTVLYSKGLHCNKTMVGDILFYRSAGIPIFGGDDQVSGGLTSWLTKMKVESVLDRVLRLEKPLSECPSSASYNSNEEGSSLTVKQCLGIWFGTIILALLGLLVKFISLKRPKDQIKAYRYDQWGNPVGKLDGDESEKEERISAAQTSFYGGLSPGSFKGGGIEHYIEKTNNTLRDNESSADPSDYFDDDLAASSLDFSEGISIRDSEFSIISERSDFSNRFQGFC